MRLAAEIEVEILKRHMDGQTRTDIAQSMGLSHQTVGNALKRQGTPSARKPRSDKGKERDRTSEGQIDWVDEYQEAPEPTGKRAYEFCALVRSSSKVNNAQTLAIAGLEAYLPEPSKATQLDCSLLIPAFAPLSFRQNVVKRKEIGAQVRQTGDLFERSEQSKQPLSQLHRLVSSSQADNQSRTTKADGGQSPSIMDVRNPRTYSLVQPARAVGPDAFQ